MVLGDVLAAGIKGAAKNGKKALKNGVKNGVNGVVNGNGIKNGLNGIDEIVSSTDTYLDVPNHGLNNYLKQARQSRNTFEKLKTAPPKSLEELIQISKNNNLYFYIGFAIYRRFINVFTYE